MLRPVLQKNAGFTMVELVATLAIGAILIALALPAMRVFMVRNKMAALSNEMLGAFALARNEAVSRSAKVTICRVTDATASTPSCAGDGSAWVNGYMAFVDTSTSAVPQPGSASAILRIYNGISQNYTVNRQCVTTGSLSFGARGVLLSGTKAVDMQIAPPEGSVKYQRHVCIGTTGRAQVMDGSCPVCQ